MSTPTEGPYEVVMVERLMRRLELEEFLNKQHNSGMDLVAYASPYLIFKQRPEPPRCSCNTFEETHFVDCELFGKSHDYPER